LIERLVSHQIIHTAKSNNTTPTTTGSSTESTDRVVEITSSMMLTGTFTVPAVVAVIAGLTAAAFTA